MTVTNTEKQDAPNGEIALCILSAINWGAFDNPRDMRESCHLAVRALDELIDYQDYPMEEAKYSATNRRTLGIGIINFAYWLAKNDLRYDAKALPVVDLWAQHWSYYLLEASIELAKEKGPCALFSETRYSQGLLPVDTYKRDVDDLVAPVDYVNWDSLRIKLSKYGIRNSTLMALMPAETSAQIANATNGIEPPRSYVTKKVSRNVIINQVVPELTTLKGKYDLLWDNFSLDGYLKITAVLQKYIDQAISVNTSYVPRRYPNGQLPTSVLLKDILNFYKYGGKLLYYNNTDDGQGEVATEDDCDSCKI